MSIKKLILIALLLSSVVQAADWVEVNVKNNWDRKSVGFCKTASQCLVSNAYNEDLDNQPTAYWSGLTSSQKPKCIDHTQYLSDNYCENGIWTSRTKLIATQLLAVALNQSQDDFSIYCDSYDVVLNKYVYRTDYGLVTTFIRGLCMQPGNRDAEVCTNNICVMKYGNDIAFGMAINTGISEAKSPLQALNLSADTCDAAKNTDGDYDTCGFNIWYNHDTESIIYAKAVTLPNPAPAQQFFITPFNKIKNYVFTVVHKPEIVQYNYTFFQPTPQFKQLYMAKEGFDFVYGFKQRNITLRQIDYAGWYFSNIELPVDTCSRIIKRYDSRANCEEQPTPAEFYIAAHKTPPVNKFDKRESLVNVWEDVIGKIRVST